MTQAARNGGATREPIDLGGLDETPWVDRTWRRVWSRVAPHVDESWLPDFRAKPFSVHEYGKGHYGVVSPTNDPGVVVKLTSDPSEAAFVAWAIEDGDSGENGLVRYHRIARLDGVTHRGRHVFVLWRAEAYEVGDFARSGGLDRIRAAYALGEASRTAGRVRLSLVRSRQSRTEEQYRELLTSLWRGWNTGARGTRRAEELLEDIHAVRRLYEAVWSTPGIYRVGEAFLDYLRKGLFLADVHLSNIGREVPGGEWIITDPGHAVVLDPDLTVPEMTVW